MPKKNIKSNKEWIITFCAHNDDQIVGVGGTLAKYAKEGKNTFTVVFSYGELSHPHIQKKVIIKKRVKESQKAEKIIGSKGIIYLALNEGKIKEEYMKRKTKKRLIKILDEKKPSIIFTHSEDDPHPDHRAVNKIILELVKSCKFKGEVYSFNVWNPFSFKRHNYTKMVVDISDTFNKKIEAFKANESQKITIFALLWGIYLKAIFHGKINHTRFAEVFSKIK